MADGIPIELSGSPWPASRDQNLAVSGTDAVLAAPVAVAGWVRAGLLVFEIAPCAKDSVGPAREHHHVAKETVRSIGISVIHMSAELSSMPALRELADEVPELSGVHTVVIAHLRGGRVPGVAGARCLDGRRREVR